jgi:predicted nucleic acid-binding protein
MWKHGTALAVLGRLASDRIRISQQVLSEYANTVVHPRKLGLTAGFAADGVEMMSREWRVLPVTAKTVTTALLAMDRWSLHYYDAQIWATAALAGIPVVLSEDFEHESRMDQVTFLNPFCDEFDLEALAEG